MDKDLKTSPRVWMRLFRSDAGLLRSCNAANWLDIHGCLLFPHTVSILCRVHETLICQKGRRCHLDIKMYTWKMRMYLFEFQEHRVYNNMLTSKMNARTHFLQFDYFTTTVLLWYKLWDLKSPSAFHALTGNGCAKCILSFAHPSVALSSTRSMFPTELTPSWGQFLEQGGNSCGRFRQGLELRHNHV